MHALYNQSRRMGQNIWQRITRVPSEAELVKIRAGAPLSPIKVAKTLTLLQFGLFFTAWLGWTVDAVDILALSLSTTRLSKFFGFGDSNHQVLLAGTFSTLLRPLGAVFYGALSDRYGRRWPFVANLIFISLVSLGTAFCKTYGQFLAVRALFGIGAGGVWALAAADGIENLDPTAKGLFSGILQEGFSVGYIIASVANLIISAHVQGPQSWRILFYFGAAASMLAAFLRALLPESPRFVQERKERGVQKISSKKIKAAMEELRWVVKTYWDKILYGSALMTLFVLLARGVAELYPLLLNITKGFDQITTSKLIIIGACGALVGGIAGGYTSQLIGYRLTILVYKVLTAVMIPAWLLPKSFGGLAAGVFFLQLGAHGGSGSLPVLLTGLSPPKYRATMSGLMFQLGIMISSFSAPTTAAIGDRMQIPNPKYVPGGQAPATIPDYTKVSGAFVGVVVIALLIFTLLGPDYSLNDGGWGVSESEENLAVEKLNPVDANDHPKPSTLTDSKVGAVDLEKIAVERDLPSLPK